MALFALHVGGGNLPFLTEEIYFIPLGLADRLQTGDRENGEKKCLCADAGFLN